MAIRFFKAKYKIFAVVPKWSFAFLQRNAKFWDCTLAAIRFSTTKYKFLKTTLKRSFVFLQQNIEFSKFYSNGYPQFPKGNTKSNYLSSI